jgi:hypothetical protein
VFLVDVSSVRKGVTQCLKVSRKKTYPLKSVLGAVAPLLGEKSGKKCGSKLNTARSNVRDNAKYSVGGNTAVNKLASKAKESKP